MDGDVGLFNAGAAVFGSLPAVIGDGAQGREKGCQQQHVGSAFDGKAGFAIRGDGVLGDGRTGGAGRIASGLPEGGEEFIGPFPLALEIDIGEGGIGRSFERFGIGPDFGLSCRGRYQEAGIDWNIGRVDGAVVPVRFKPLVDEFRMPGQAAAVARLIEPGVGEESRVGIADDLEGRFNFGAGGAKFEVRSVDVEEIEKEAGEGGVDFRRLSAEGGGALVADLDAGKKFDMVGALPRMDEFDTGGGGGPGIVIAAGDVEGVGGAVKGRGAGEADEMAAGFEIGFDTCRGADQGEFPIERGELMTIEMRLQNAGGAQAVDVMVLAEHAVSNVAFEDEYSAAGIVFDGVGRIAGNGREEA